MDEMEQFEEMWQVIHGASLEIQLDPLVSSASTRPRTVVRSLWLEGAVTLSLLAESSALHCGRNLFFLLDGRGTDEPKPPIRHPLRMVWVTQTPHPSSVTDGIGKWPGQPSHGQTVTVTQKRIGLLWIVSFPEGAFFLSESRVELAMRGV